MHRFLLPGLGALLFSGTLALSASAMEPLAISATDQADASLVLSAEQAYFAESSDDWSRSVQGFRMPAGGDKKHQPPQGHTLLDMSF